VTASPPSSPAPSAAVPGSIRAGAKPPVVTHGPRTGDKVALTFDADLTDFQQSQLASGKVRSYANLAVLDQLERDHVAATFFLTGQWVEQYPDVTRRIAANDRFELANHSYEHMGFVPKCYGLAQVPPALMATDVSHAFDVIAPYGGRQTRYFRFPGGCFDSAALEALAPLGLTVVQWDVVSGDPFATAAAPIVQAVLAGVRPGSIVVMHITEENAKYTDDALPEILAGLRSRGLRPVTLSELLAG
jgi:peptidoglycan/xylan/chitin deacetylase (PgdA/CDA1 family)